MGHHAHAGCGGVCACVKHSKETVRKLFSIAHIFKSPAQRSFALQVSRVASSPLAVNAIVETTSGSRPGLQAFRGLHRRS
jgi:hypothetical protein